MKIFRLTTANFIILLIIVLLASCKVETKLSAIEKDANKFVKTKCENRIELNKYAADANITMAKLDSIRKAYNKDLKKVRNKYSKDKDLEKKFQDAVDKAFESMPECKKAFNKDNTKRKKRRK